MMLLSIPCVRRFTCAAWLLVLAAGCVRQAPQEAAAAQWHLMRTPRFEVMTDGDPEVARALVQDLERFHQVMLHKTSAKERDTTPLRVFLTRDRAAYRAFGAPKRSAGVFMNTPRGAFALVDVSPASDISGRHVLFHEYVHHVLALAGSAVPSWYNEGLAEYMATTEFMPDGSYTVGKAPTDRLDRLARAVWIPIERVLEADNIMSIGGPSDSYAQAWYMLHYFAADQARADQLRQLLHLWRQQVPTAEAVQQALGMSLQEFDRAIFKHAGQARLDYVSIKPAVPLRAPIIPSAEVTSAEAHYRLGELLLNTSGPVRSTMDVLKQASLLAPEDSRVDAALARAYMDWFTTKNTGNEELEGERPRGDLAHLTRVHVDRARRHNPNNPDVLTLEGRLNALEAERRWTERNDAALLALNRARNFYRKAIGIDDRAAEAYLALGKTYLLDDNGSKEAMVVLEEAGYLMPLALDVPLTIARLEINRGNYLQAIAPLKYAQERAHGRRISDEARALLDKLKQVVAKDSVAGAAPVADP